MLKTFPKGGIHPAENKLTSTKEIKKLPTPKVVYVPISQHIGIPSEIIVERKDKVKPSLPNKNPLKPTVKLRVQVVPASKCRATWPI